MKSGIKMIILAAIVFCGISYVVNFEVDKLIGVNLFNELFNLNEEDKQVINNDLSNDIIVNNGDDVKDNNELILVNEEHGLSKNYKPQKLVIPNILFTRGVSNEEKHVSSVIEKPLERLVASAKNDGIILLGNSGYRSYKTQEKTYENRVKSKGESLADSYVAKPGYSEHQTGLCIDMTNESENMVKNSKEAAWLDKNCYKFGFIIRYPYGKKDITGIEYEPWHIRYVGEKAAKYIHDNDSTLEQYLEK